MKWTISVTAIFLTSCTTVVPVKQTFPDVPSTLLERCPQLVQLAPTETAITDLLRVVVKNYTTYYECAVRHDGMVEWYQIQKEIFNGANK